MSTAVRGGLPLPTDRAFWASVDDRGLLARAQTERGTPWPQPLAGQYARYRRDGDRVEYEAQVFGREDRLTRAVVAALVTDDRGWVDEVADGVTLLCEQSSWCWPAHDVAAAALGTVVPVVTEPVLDLGAGEVAARLAWIDHVLGEQLDARVPGLRRRIRHEVRTRVLDPFVARDDWGWLVPPLSNWTAWIHANVLTAALALLEPPERDAVVARVADGLGDYLASLPPDGAIDEGYSYWWQGACRALEALTLLEHATGEDASTWPVVRAMVDYPHTMHLGGRWYLGVGDGTATPPTDLPWHVLHAWALRTGSSAAADHAAAEHAHAGPPRARRHRPHAGGAGVRRLAVAHARAPRCPRTSGSRARRWGSLRETAGSPQRADRDAEGRAQRRVAQPQRRRLRRRRGRRGAGGGRPRPAHVHRADVRPGPVRHLDDAEHVALGPRGPRHPAAPRPRVPGRPRRRATGPGCSSTSRRPTRPTT